ncbi:molybdopterin-guanine dinucleotide biosynthesis protein B [Candidatus Bathyarchaeota archaeon]|nr:molybdopterin-guanine dinucleotide biosynthesis protein B [Candidatus Bathyarchaeota archaeon]MBS7630385.1 molybdopterin-guanine dinucleotide biosynthesis protein B [Candidatus Bathyarchaeota archaeon]
MKTKIVSVVGFKKSGKTMVIESLTKELTKRGYAIGTVKHGSEKHAVDTPRKDTWRHMQAGSKASAILTPTESAFFITKPLSVRDAIAFLGERDFIILEGFKSLDTVARIIVLKDAEEVKSLSNGAEIAVLIPPTIDPVSIKTDAPKIRIDEVEKLADLVESKAFPFLNGFDCGSCGYRSCAEMAQAIVRGAEKASKCVYMNEENVKLIVNGKEIPIKGFVQDFIARTVLGMVSSLKGVEEPKRIELLIKNGDLLHE